MSNLLYEKNQMALFFLTDGLSFDGSRLKKQDSRSIRRRRVGKKTLLIQVSVT
jgi:hypothetical protein